MFQQIKLFYFLSEIPPVISLAHWNSFAESKSIFTISGQSASAQKRKLTEKYFFLFMVYGGSRPKIDRKLTKIDQKLTKICFVFKWDECTIRVINCFCAYNSKDKQCVFPPIFWFENTPLDNFFGGNFPINGQEKIQW